MGLSWRSGSQCSPDGFGPCWSIAEGERDDKVARLAWFAEQPLFELFSTQPGWALSAWTANVRSVQSEAPIAPERVPRAKSNRA